MAGRSRGRSVTLKGAAARAAFLSLGGRPATDEAEALRQVAVRVHMEVHAGGLEGAVAVLRALMDRGAVAVAAEIAGVAPEAPG